jgi:Ca-activated chloride channel family protein
VLTLFPTPKTEEGIKGGVVLLRVQPPPGTTIATAPPLKLSAQYTDRWGAHLAAARTGAPGHAALRTALCGWAHVSH